MRQWVGLGVIAENLHNIGAVLAKRKTENGGISNTQLLNCPAEFTAGLCDRFHPRPSEVDFRRKRNLALESS